MALGIGMTGIVILALPLATGGISPLGILFPMIAAVSWAAGSVYQKSHPIDGDRMVMTAYQLLLASAVAAVGYLASGEVMPASLSREAWIAIVFHVIGATAFAYVLWFTLLARVSVAAASLTTLAIPVVGVIGAMTIVGERPAALDYVGFAAVLAAAGVTMLGARPGPRGARRGACRLRPCRGPAGRARGSPPAPCARRGPACAARRSCAAPWCRSHWPWPRRRRP
jgi:drug/metabolite transporter (DMT)-like permease